MTLAVVTRYFGGIKLGASGLVSAYSSCVASAIDKAQIVEYKISNSLLVEVDYSIHKKVQELIEKEDGQVRNIEYFDAVKFDCVVPVENFNSLKDKIIDLTSGQAKIEIINTKYNKFIEAKK